MSARRIYFDGGPLHGTTRTVPENFGPRYRVPLLPSAPSLKLPPEEQGPTVVTYDILEYVATDKWVVDVPGGDAEVYRLPNDVRRELLPDALLALARDRAALDRLAGADIEMLDRIAWSATRRPEGATASPKEGA